MKKVNWGNILAISSVLVLSGILISILSISIVRSQIQVVSGLAVAQSATRWNNVKDAAQGDGLTNGILGIAPYVFDGTTLNRIRSNFDVTLLASGVRAATNSTADQTNYSGRGCVIVFDITVVPGGDTVTLSIQGKDPVSSKYYTILTGAAEAATATRVYRIFPNLTAVPNATANDILPKTWNVTVTHSAATNFTYSVGASVIQ